MSAVEDTLRGLRDRFMSEVPWGQSWLQAMEQRGFQPTHIQQSLRSDGRGRPGWIVRAAPPGPIQEGFGLAPEVLFLAVQGEVQAQDLKRAADEVIISGLRVDGNLVVVTDEGTTSLPDRLARMPGRGQRVAWIRSTGQNPERWPPLDELLREQLPTINVYEERGVVRGAQLLGRDEETALLRTRLVRGDAVAVLGLRKVGKTSLVRAVTDWLDPASGVESSSIVSAETPGVVVWMDAEAIIEPTVDAVADELLRSLRQRTRSAGEDESGIPGAGGLPAWKRICEQFLDAGRQLTVVIDEYDVLFESGDEGAPIPGLSRLFRLMRAWSQQRQGQLSLVMIGRDPSFIGAPELDRTTSPLFLWCSPMWLGPLHSEQDTLLLRHLGKRVGLRIGHHSATRARAWTGGHPMLHRQFGAALWTLMRSRRCGWGTDSDQLLDAADATFVARKEVSAIARELRELLRQRYPDALRLLVDLIHSDPAETVALHGGPTSDAYVLLKNFGVLGDEADAVPEYLRWYFDRYAPERVASRAG